MKLTHVISALALALTVTTAEAQVFSSTALDGAFGEIKVSTVDIARCYQGPSASNLEGAWTTDFQTPGVNLEMSFYFGGGEVTLENKCHFANGRSLVAQVSSPYYNNYGSFTVTSSAQDIERIDEPGFQATCDVSVSPGTVRYSFVGSCLQLHDPSGQSLLLAPK